MRAFLLCGALVAALGWARTAAAADKVDTNFVIRWFNSSVTREQELARSYVAGISDGMLASSVAADIAKQKPLYCQPKDLVLSTNLLMQLVTAYVAKRPNAGKEWFGLIAFNAVRDAYPCK